MNSRFLQSNYAGFKLNDTLATKLSFSGVFRVWSIDKGTRHRADGEETEYWIIKDEFGAKISSFNKKLVETLQINERYAVKGDIKIGKGATFLNLKEADVLHGSDFEVSEKVE